MITVIALPTLLGVGALAVDLALMSLSAQRVQNVVDTAALAGAVQGADASAAVLAANQTAAGNNTGSPWPVDTIVTAYGPGDTVPGFRALGYREHVTEVSGATDFRFVFGRIFGLERATVRRDAAAMCEVWRNRLGEGFIFAGSTDPSVWGIYSDGLRNNFDGSIHANTGISLNGKDNTLSGDIRYRHSFTQNGPGFVHDGDVIETPVTEYPVDFTWADFDRGPWDHDVPGINVAASGSLSDGRWRVRGDMTVSCDSFHCEDAFFVVDGNVLIQGSRLGLDRVTIVGRGTVDFLGPDTRFSPDLHDLLAMTTKVSSSDVMYIDGARCLVSGVLYAPNGGLYFEGSAEESYQVGLVANTVRLIGSGCTHEGPASALVCDTRSRAKLVL